MIQLYGHELSGNSYKAKLMLDLLKIDYQWNSVDVMAGAHKRSEFLAMNSFGQIPVLVDGDRVLADAQAILVYLARQYGGESWLPLEAEPMSRLVRWLSTAAGEVRQGPEFARLYHLFKLTSIDIGRAIEKSAFILDRLNAHLSDREWLELGHPTIADVAVFPYVALARDGKIDLDSYPHVLAWIDRVKQLPGYIPMPGL
ncbi:glutathione S-transferase [Pseudanabaena sp. PCC 6802]|uniref:glutathione S-transferase family protein n=1 Tax=Pseudanabaena sp. PCC 6802 TaxID=118173 RepID=UPI000347C3A2